MVEAMLKSYTVPQTMRHVPVHPALLAEWRLGGVARDEGALAGPDDLIAPLPPDLCQRWVTRPIGSFVGRTDPRDPLSIARAVTELAENLG